MKVLAITRAEIYSPNSVEKDRAIMEAVADRLREKGCDVCLIGEDSLTFPDYIGSLESPDLILTMGRRPETIAWLKHSGVEAVNTPEGVENCSRSRLQAIMECIGTPVPPKEGSNGYWLKRGDAAAQTSDDVMFATDKEALAAAVRTMRDRGIKDFVVSAHVMGDLVKFYGVGQGRFFRYYYPTDDGQSKFGDECRNGTACHYPFDSEALQREAERLAEAVGVNIYGGDAIVRANGSFCLIDFNDWPSFSRCREEAAEEIVKFIV